MLANAGDASLTWVKSLPDWQNRTLNDAASRNTHHEIEIEIEDDEVKIH